MSLFDTFSLSSTEETQPESEPPSSTQFIYSTASKVKRTILGAPRNIKDPGIFHRISLIALLAWVGLGADGLSSSSYGPDESFRALGSHTYLAIALALATAFTVFIIAYSYTRIIEHFPYGGGGYVVASKLLGPKFGVVSGSALLVDYVLTISVSIASGADQVFSVLPPHYRQYKLIAVSAVIIVLMIMNLRGVKESVTLLMPIFVLFVLTHFILIVGGFATHAFEVGNVVNDIGTGFQTGLSTLGLGGMFLIFIRAYSMGAGTYTGIEAVSNGIQIMREPKVETARKTMMYMGISLAVTAGGILMLYLLFHASPEPGKTMNAVLLERFAGNWQIGSVPIGYFFVVLTLGAEAALLFVAAQAGFIDGPRIMSNMAIDSWFPHRFRSLSDRLTMENGVVLIAGSAILTLLLTKGQTSTLVLMYSINVFLTFSLSELGMVRFWIQNRKKHIDWKKNLTIQMTGLFLTVSILFISLFEKLTEGGWITIVVTFLLVALCLLIKRHYRRVGIHMKRLDSILDGIPSVPTAPPAPLNPKAQTAVMLVGEYGGLGIHSFLSIQRLFPNYFKNFIFVSINVIDAGNLKGAEDFTQAEQETKASLEKYVALASQFGLSAEFRMGSGTEVLEEAQVICQNILKEFPRSIFFLGKLVFEKERWYQRFLHNETASAMQRRLQFDGLNSMILPIRVYSGGTVPPTHSA
jgi:amino acid transporter